MRYNNIIFVGYMVNTSPNPNNTYPGYKKQEEDIANRRMLMLAAIESAKRAVPKSSKCLKIFMAPEFYFRGTKGAYDFEKMIQLIDSLQFAVRNSTFKDWLFIFGSILGYSYNDTSDKLEVYNMVLVQKGSRGHEGAHVILKEHLSHIDFYSRGKRPKRRNSINFKQEDVVHLHVISGPGW
ncbi:MAG: hypothetical protein GY718_09605, partial [Lentisphaerae bacterium]|nr:hypothetical protein [Lentisphaerota bacterium]